MKPLKLQDLSSKELCYGKHGTLMLLNTTRVGAHYLRQLLSHNRLSVRSRTADRSRPGSALPIEVWDLVLGHIPVPMGTRAGGKRLGYCSGDDFSWVQIMRTSRLASHPDAASSPGTVLQCRKVQLEGVKPCGSFENYFSVDSFEAWLQAPNPVDRSKAPEARDREIWHDSLDGWFAEELGDGEVPEVVPVSKDDPFATFDILLQEEEEEELVGRLPVPQGCLHWRVEVPDVLARHKGGDCFVCGGSTWIGCAHCEWLAGRGDDRDLFRIIEGAMGCGYGANCPLCLGSDFSARGWGVLWDARDNERYGDDSKEMLDEWQGQVDERLLEVGHDV